MSGKYSRFWPDFDKVSVLCLDRSPIAHNLVVCTWTSGQVDAAACPSMVGSQTIVPALCINLYRRGEGGVLRFFTRAFHNLMHAHAMRTRLSNSHPRSPSESLGTRLTEPILQRHRQFYKLENVALCVINPFDV